MSVITLIRNPADISFIEDETAMNFIDVTHKQIETMKQLHHRRKCFLLCACSLINTSFLISAEEVKLPDSLTKLKIAADHVRRTRAEARKEYFRLLEEALVPSEQYWLRKRDAKYMEQIPSMKLLADMFFAGKNFSGR